MQHPHWQTFLSIEQDLAASIPFVDFRSENYGTISVNFQKIILLSCSEIEAVMKMFCKTLDNTVSAKNIDGWRNVVISRYKFFPQIDVSIPKYSINLKPWSEWTSGKNPGWWTAYNKLKHDRSTEFSRSTQEHAYQSLAGLFGLLLYFHEDSFANSEIVDHPKLYWYDGMFGHGYRGPPSLKLPKN